MPSKRSAKKTTREPSPSAKRVPRVRLPAAASAIAGAPAIIRSSRREEKAAAKLGPQLRATMERFRSGGALRGMARMSLDMAAAGVGAAVPEPIMPMSAAIPVVAPEPKEKWKHYKERLLNTMGPVMERLKSNAGLRCLPVVSGNSMQTQALMGQVMEAAQDDGVAHLELDPPVVATALDDSVEDLEMPLFRVRHPTLDGTGVTVAVLDSGLDTQHPWLKVSGSFSIHGQDVAIPGAHGTHVAGCLCSKDSVYGGVAPGVTLLNIRVLDASGVGRKDDIGRGIDKALDEGAQILNLSLSWNHRPKWSQLGHGHACPEGHCTLCMAVDNAMTMSDGAVAVIVAAGNQHEFCEFLRSSGHGDTFDTELCCPGQARLAITVGALTKQTFLTAPFSSRGPTAYKGENVLKPDIAAPGVNITSCAIAPRNADGTLIPDPTRSDLSRLENGTSMAAPIVSGAAALILQRLLAADGGKTIPELRAALRHELLTNAFRHLAAPATEVGVGRLNLGSL